MHIGLTGGIGSGKSTVLQMLVELGATAIDADAISRKATSSGGAAIAVIGQRFGPDFINSEGGLDRARMREHAFANPKARKLLEEIIHPLVGQESARQTEAARLAGSRCIVFDIPLLVESRHWRSRLHRILVVDCTEETQIERVLARNGLPRTEIQRIIAAQASRKQRLAAADIVIHNQGLSLDALRATVAQLAEPFGL